VHLGRRAQGVEGRVFSTIHYDGTRRPVPAASRQSWQFPSAVGGPSRRASAQHGELRAEAAGRDLRLHDPRMTSGSKLTWWAVGARHAAFLVPFLLYARYLFQPHLQFEADPRYPIFYSNPGYWHEAVSYPAGPALLVSGFLGLAGHSPWLCALLVTALLGLVGWTTEVLILALGGDRVRFLACIPAVPLIVSLNGLISPMPLLVPLLSALLSFAFYLGLAAGSDGRRIAVFLVSGVLLHYIAGGAFLLYALLVGLYELLAKRRRLPALISLLSMEAIPYLTGAYLYNVGIARSFIGGLPLPSDEWLFLPQVASYVCFPLLLVALAAGRAVATRRKPEAQPGRGTRPARDWSWVGTAVLVGAAALAAGLSFNPDTRRVQLVDKCAHRGDWEGVLRHARRLPRRYTSDLVAQHTNRALYERGSLGDAMFSYPQVPGRLMVDDDLGHTPAEQDARMHRRTALWFQLGDLDLRLGLVNEAEHEAHEALAMHGPHPEILKRLALVNLVKRQPAAARVFLRALAYNPVYETYAESLLRRMAADPDLADDPYVSEIRAVRCLRDRVSVANELPERCLSLLGDHPHHRMAFEYLMAHYLLRRDLAAFARELPRLRVLGYPEMPRHYQEAILLHEKETVRPSDRAGYPISPDVLQELADFSRAMQTTGGSAPALADEFGDTYLFYYTFGVTGAMVQR